MPLRDQAYPWTSRRTELQGYSERNRACGADYSVSLLPDVGKSLSKRTGRRERLCSTSPWDTRHVRLREVRRMKSGARNTIAMGSLS